MPRYDPADFKEFCLQFYRELNHPYSPKNKIQFNIGDLEISLDIFESVLSIECEEKALHGLSEQFYSAFNSYLSSTRNEIGLLCNAADKLSTLIDPFLKKVALIFMPDKKFKTPTGKLVPFWKASKYVVILEALDIIKASEIAKTSPFYWEKKTADLAILRQGFTARQKGVHESWIHNLEGLEKIVYSIIGTYVVVCLKLSTNPSINRKFKKIIEKRRAIYLFQERVRSYPITNTLFSKKEHLFAYRYRAELSPDIEGKKFLFLNYLAGRGPCFYWFQRKDKEIMIAWAKEYLTETRDEIVKQNAIRFLIENSAVTVRLQTLLDSFSHYEEKEELSQYIRRFAKPYDRDRLLKLCTDKREEVALISQELISNMFPKIDETFKKIATSQSTSKRKLLRSIIRNFVQENDLDRYRNFIKEKDKAQQIIYIYSLGEVGTEKDLELLSNWVASRRRNRTVRIACWYSISRIANRIRNSQLVWSLINKKDRVCKIAALEGLTRAGIGPNFELLFSKGFVQRFDLGDIVLEIATENDREVIRKYLTKAALNYRVRDLVLALCKVGDSKDCEFLLNLFSKYKDKIDFHNHVRVADSIAKICSKKKWSSLKKTISSKEFWSYIQTEQQRPKNRLPVENVDNQAFMRRLIAACFIEKAPRKDIDLIQKLLHHYYKWIAYKAATKLSEIGRVRDLNNLLQALWNLDEENLNYSDAALHGLCLLDKKLHKLN